MSESAINSFFSDIPIRNTEYLTMKMPNEPIEIYTGIFSIRVPSGTFKCDGKLYYRWFPYCRIAFEGNIIEEPQLFFYAVNSDDIELLIDDIYVGNGTVLSAESNSSYIIGTSDKITIGDSSVPVSEIYFPVINLREYHGTAIRNENQNSAYKGRISFEDHEYKIFLDKPQSSKQRIKLLTANGGFIDTYTGKIIKAQGEAMTSGNTTKVFDCLNELLYFFNGFRCGMPFLIGVHNGEVVWTEYRKISAYSYKFVQSWSDAIFLGNTNVVWKRMRELWNDVDCKDVLNTSIYWYNQANFNSAGLEGSIILSQTALELLYNWIIVERRKMIIGSDALNINAANKIRMLLSTLNVGTEIPEKFDELKRLSNIDGPEAFVFIRNALVHGNEEKRKKLQEIPIKAIWQASHLAIWYIELCILKILDYDGKYGNRTISPRVAEGQFVPWVNDQTYS